MKTLSVLALGWVLANGANALADGPSNPQLDRQKVSENLGLKSLPTVQLPSAVDLKDRSRQERAVKPASERMERPEAIDRSVRADSSDAIKKMLDDIKAAQAKFLAEQKDLQVKLKMKDATDDEREKIRADIRDKRELFLQQQRDMREEFRKKVNELKDQMKDHGDLLDDAKEGVKTRPKPR